MVYFSLWLEFPVLSSRNFTCPNEGQNPLASLTVTAKSTSPCAIESNPKLLFSAACGEISFLPSGLPFHYVLSVLLCAIFKCSLSIFRTNLFFKEQKEYSHLVFMLVLIFFLALGAWTWVPAQQVCHFCFLFLERFSNESEQYSITRLSRAHSIVDH